MPEGMKWCRDCEEVKAVDDFPIATRKASGRNSYCKPCFQARVVASRIKVHGDRREYHLRHRYGIGVADVECMLADQDNKCLICDKPDPEHVDHDHGTGRVRGILCFNCNQGLGNFRDDLRSLGRAVDYLMRGSSWKGKGLDGFQVSRYRFAAA
ncbi:MAG TPA: endonuclease VII domain-containing protein [Actinocrinis sp.]|nr:endonuclease VII domain-containing protein [Actinocrinis sp.]